MSFLNDEYKIKKEFSRLNRIQKNILETYCPTLSFNLKELAEDNNLPDWIIKECKSNSKIWRDDKPKLRLVK